MLKTSFTPILYRMRFSVNERKKYVILLRERGYTIRKIAYELNMSTRDVIKILKEYDREVNARIEIEILEKEENEKKRIFLSTRSKALQLYKEGMKPLDVAIKLNLNAKEANSFYEEYCALQYPTQVVEILTKLNDRKAGHFINLYHLITEKGLSIEEGIEAIEITDDLSLLKEEYQYFSTEVPNLKWSHKFYLQENNILNKEIAARYLEHKSISEKTDMAEKNLQDILKIKRQKEEETFKIKSEEIHEESSKKNRSYLDDVLISNKNEILPTPNFDNALQEDKPQQTNFVKDLSKSGSDQDAVNNLKDDDDTYQEKLPYNTDGTHWRSYEMEFLRD